MATPCEISAIILAAGAATRMGSPKQLLELGGQTLVERAVAAASRPRCATVRVVVGAHEAEVRDALQSSQAEIVVARRWREGLSASIAAGVAATVKAGAPGGILILLADQPRVGASTVDALIDEFDGAPGSIVAAGYNGAVGVPALFGASHFEVLGGLTGDRGAKALLEQRRERVTVVPCQEAAADVDTPADWAALIAADKLGRSGE